MTSKIHSGTGVVVIAVFASSLFLSAITPSFAYNPANDAKNIQYNQSHSTIPHEDQRHSNSVVDEGDKPMPMKKESTLLLVQVLFRHGDRSPLHSFPTDINKDKWPQGYGQLTELGVTQGFELGQFLSRFYSSFIGPDYHPDEVHIQSTDTDRTLMTAQCVAAGLFSKQSRVEEKSRSVLWQPVPIHTMPRQFDKMLSPDKVCDYVSNLKYGLKAYFYSKQAIMKDKITMFALSEYSGLVMNFTTLHALADTLFCERVHNMSRHTWLKDGMETRLFSFYHQLPVLMPEEAKYLAGFLLETILDNMMHKAKHPEDKHKLYLYSAHQGNVHSLMSLLGVFHKDTTIPYATAVILELHRINGKLFVKLLFKTTDAFVPKLLRLPGCRGHLCPLSALTDLHDEPPQKAWQDMCGLASQENVIDFGENTIPILIAILVAFIGLDFFLLYKTFKYRQRLNIRDGKESYALVRTDDGSSSGSGSDADDDGDDFNSVEMGEDTQVLMTKDLHSKRHKCKKPNHATNGRKKMNGSKVNGKRSRIGRDRDIDSDDSFEETSLFVAPPK